MSDVNTDDGGAPQKRKRAEAGSSKRKRKLKSREERNNLAGRSGDVDDSEGETSSKRSNKQQRAAVPTKQSGKIKSRAYISDSDSSISSAPDEPADSNPAPVSRLLSSDSDSGDDIPKLPSSDDEK